MQPGAKWTWPAAKGEGTQRVLYFFRGSSAQLAGQEVKSPSAVQVRADASVELVAGGEGAEFLLLQGRPIAEPVAQYGPFVMNTQAEIMQAMQDYRRTQFGGWKWKDPAPVHGHEPKRFANYPDGRVETP